MDISNRNLKSVLLFSCLFLFSSIPKLRAQQRKVSGKVIDSQNNKGLPSVNILVKGTSIGTTTDPSGNFSLSVPSLQDTLVFSFVGYQSKNIPINGRTTINITLSPTELSGQEVVVVGYGSKQKRDLTGSIQQVSPKDLNAVASPNVTEALQGRSAGVAVMTNNQPGGDPTIRIRGTSSISAGNDPLVVVDGFPLVNGNLNDINPDNIKSVEVLKDASATAIYGSRGSNGVIIITTKSGRRGKTRVTLNSYYGIQTPARLVNTLDRNEFINFINTAYKNQTGNPVFTDEKPAPQYNTDWQDVTFKDSSPIQSHTLSLQGGNESTTYLLSGGYFNQEGLLNSSGFERYTFRTNLEHDLKDWVTVGTHLQLNRSIRNVNFGTPINIFRFGWPVFPLYENGNPDNGYYFPGQDPRYSAYIEGNWHPLAEANEKTDRRAHTRILGDVYAKINFTDHLFLRSNFGTDLTDGHQYFYGTRQSGVGRNSGGRGEQNYSREYTIVNENRLTYENSWFNHNLEATGVYSFEENNYSDLDVQRSHFPSDITGAHNIGLGGQGEIPQSDRYSSRLISLTGRVSYDYAKKYFLTLTSRYDGSSRFGANNKWGFFPSVGVAWRISEEAFMNNLNAVSNLKFRASLGVTGNQEIGNYQSLPQLSRVNYVYNDELLPGLSESIGNSDLKWERSKQLDLGVDLGLWNDAVNVTADYYKTNTSDLLYNVPIPVNSGYYVQLQNIGEVENKGWEASLDAQVFEGAFQWSVGGNITSNKNKVVKLYNNNDKLITSNSMGVSTRLQVGKPVNGVWAFESVGIINDDEEAQKVQEWQPGAEPGDQRFVDQNGDGYLDQQDHVFIGTTVPNFYYGLNTTLQYQNFQLDIYAQGANNIAVNSTDSYLVFGEYQIDNRNYLPSQYAYDRMWSPNNKDGTFPRPGANNGYFSDASNGHRAYFIIKNIKLSYNFSPSTLENIGIQDLTIYANAQNYASFANFRGYNPETGSYESPLAKSIRLGINLTL